MLVSLFRTDANGDNEAGDQACNIQIQSQMFEAIRVIVILIYPKLLELLD
jgi:hypothetical protein